MITSELEKSVLADLFNGASNIPATLYIGLCNNEQVSRDMTLADLSEVTGTGYARIALARGTVDWQTPVAQSDSYSLTTAIKTFEASGSDWTEFNRMFLTDAASGTSGKLLAISTALPTPVTLTSGKSFPTAFKLFLQ